MHFARQSIPSLTFDYLKDKYVTQDKKEIFIHRPRVEIRLSNGQQNIKLPMLVDSGADITLIPLEVADIVLN